MSRSAGTSRTPRKRYRRRSSNVLRATFLFSSASDDATSESNASNNKFTKGKKREDELERLAGAMDVDIPKLNELLKKQRTKLTAGSNRATYIDWLLELDDKEPSEEAITTPPSETDALSNEEAAKETSGNSSDNKKRSTRVIRPKRPKIVTERAEAKKAEAKARQSEALRDPTLLTSIKFADRDDLHPSSKRAVIEVMGLKTMTEIQAKTYAAALTGQDVLGRARTGTGKTLAFLLPAIERILQSADYVSGRTVGCLVISPTRELATQIGDQARMLLTYHTDLSVQVMYGGTKMQRDITMLTRSVPTILVATPGRLQDHLEGTRINGRKFSDIMSETGLLVLDETDRLLDLGFRREIRRIITYLPRKEKRQTLLFSATIPQELRNIMKDTMKDDFVEVDCIQDKFDGSTETNVRVEQHHVILPSIDHYLSSVVEIVTLAMKEDEENNKIVVFFPAAKIVSFFADFFNEGLDIPVLELHSRKSQSARNRASDSFRTAKKGILFTSDVSARGVDYPDVSHVIQFGAPDSREQYIHRLGRTARAGKKGKGLLVLSPFESMFLTELKGIDIPIDSEMLELLENPVSSETNDNIRSTLERIRSGDAKLTQSAQGAYQAFLGYYIGQMKRLRITSKEDLVQYANQISSLCGLAKIPELSKRLVSKMGLDGVSGIAVASSSGSAEKRQKGRSNRKGHYDGRRAPL